MPSGPSLKWQKLQDVYYSHSVIYEKLNWSIENLYTNYRVAFSSYGTLIALASKFVPHPNIIDIYSLSGTKIWSVVYNSRPDNHIVDFLFRNEDLVVVLNNGTVRYYRDFKGNFEEYDYTQKSTKLENANSKDRDTSEEAENQILITNLENNEVEEGVAVLQAKCWRHYLVVRLSNRFIIRDFESELSYEFPLKDLSSNNIHCFEIIKTGVDDQFSVSISYDKTIVSYKVDLGLGTFEFQDHALTHGPFSSILPSPNGQLIALSNDSSIFVINNQYDYILLEYSTSNEFSSPYQVSWCGNDAICLSLRDEIKLIGPGQKSISFFYDIEEEEEEFDIDTILKDTTANTGSVANEDLQYKIPILLTQSDGLKVITSTSVEFITRVSAAQSHLYQIGSSHPSSILLDCIDKLDRNSSKADTSISLLNSDKTLGLAISECLIAVLEELDHFWQKKILHAVSFGKTYYEDYYNTDDYLKTVNILTVLNQIRSPELGLFLTYSELKNMDWEEFLQMLLKRDQHLLALKIIDLLNIPQYKHSIYVHWCCYKIKKELNMTDLELLKIISKKLISSGGEKNHKNYISVEEISNVAHEEGRIELCKYLINLEPSITKKISQYLKFDEVELALIKSFQMGDYDLSKLILLHLQDKLSKPQFFKILNQNESIGKSDDSNTELRKAGVDIPNDNLSINGDLIGHFWAESIGKLNSNLLETYYIQEDKKQELGISRLSSFLKKENVRSSDSYYADYKPRLLKSISRSGNRRYNRLYQRELDILELQKKLGETFVTSFYNEKSLNEILIKLIGMNQIKTAKSIVRDFKLSQERFWNLVLKIYSESRNFENLYKFAFGSKQPGTEAKSPIGFEPFVEAGFKHKAPRNHISEYIKHCTNIKYTERIDLFVKNHDLELAAGEAFRNKDIDILRDLLNGFGDNEEGIRLVKGYISKLGY